MSALSFYIEVLQALEEIGAPYMTENFPKSEIYGMTRQIRRAAASVRGRDRKIQSPMKSVAAPVRFILRAPPSSAAGDVRQIASGILSPERGHPVRSAQTYKESNIVTIETCSGCEGTGKIDGPVCNGRGRVSKKKSFLQTIECPQCRGIGKLVCSLCGGVGQIRDRADERPSVWRRIFGRLW